MYQQKLFDNKGHSILLSKELGKGGEGAVFSILNNPEIVAKIYNKIPDVQKAEKISNMISIGNERLRKLTTWPINSIHTSDNRLIGFTMPKLTDHKPISDLYSPKIRLREFPKADWRFLIHTAINTARAFSAIHEEGHVVGDVNHGNLFVASNATVQFIDTDSFQIYFKNKYWHCEVGVATHQPPEMQNISSYKGIIRTPNHDNFGLAILLFQLLCLARHPFSGRYLGDGDMPIEKAILEYRYAYSSDVAFTKMSPPPASLPISGLPTSVRLNFERAFSKEGRKLDFRPSPQEWITALTELSSKLKQCLLNPSHYFFLEQNNCPWCDIETLCNASLFPIIHSKSIVSLDINVLWQQFQSLKTPIAIPTLPNIEHFQTIPSNIALEIEKKLKSYRYKFGFIFLMAIAMFYGSIGYFAPIIGLIALLILFAFFMLYNECKKNLTETILQELNLLKPKWESLCLQHENLAKNYTCELLRNQINELKTKHDEVVRSRENRFKTLLNNRFQQQLKQYLDTHRIANANIDGIGQGRVATLLSYSIETAADVEIQRLMNVAGFGHVLISRLLDWRKSCETGFVFASKQSISPNEVAALDREILGECKPIEVEISTKIEQLSLLSKEINLSRKQLQDQINAILPKYAQALADARAVGLKT